MYSIENYKLTVENVALWIFVLYQDYQSSGVCSVKDDAVPAEVDEQQSYMQAGDVLETLFMNG